MIFKFQLKRNGNGQDRYRKAQKNLIEIMDCSKIQFAVGLTRLAVVVAQDRFEVQGSDRLNGQFPTPFATQPADAGGLVSRQSSLQTGVSHSLSKLQIIAHCRFLLVVGALTSVRVGSITQVKTLNNITARPQAAMKSNATLGSRCGNCSGVVAIGYFAAGPNPTFTNRAPPKPGVNRGIRDQAMWQLLRRGCHSRHPSTL